MEIDLQKLNYQDDIKIDTDITYLDSFLEGTEIIHLNNVHVSGVIEKDIEFNAIPNLVLTGTMILIDAISSEEIPYEFSVEIEENLGNSMKTLDLNEFLWHYIVLEIPLRVTNRELSYVETPDYRVISEEEYKNNKNNPFKDFHLE